MQKYKKIIIIALLAVLVILYNVYYNRHMKADYNVTSFGNYDNNPDEISKIEMGLNVSKAHPYHEMFMIEINDIKNIRKVTNILDKMRFIDNDDAMFDNGSGLFWVKCYNKENTIVFGIGLAYSDESKIYCMLNGENYFLVNSKCKDDLGEIYLNLRGEIPK